MRSSGHRRSPGYCPDSQESIARTSAYPNAPSKSLIDYISDFDFCDVVVEILVDITDIDHLIEVEALFFCFLVEFLLFLFADLGEVEAWLIVV